MFTQTSRASYSSPARPPAPLRRGHFPTSPMIWIAAALIPWAFAAPAAAGVTWRFDRAPEGWSATMTTPLEIRDGALSFRATGQDPILFSPEISHETSPLDVVEIEVASSVSGTAELFWRHDRKGPFGGFSAELSKSFEIRGGKNSIRVRPFWQGRGPVIALRFDPPGGEGEFALKAVRIVPGASGKPAKASFDFADAGRASGRDPAARDATLGWSIDPPGSLRLSEDGLHGVFSAPSARLASPLLDLDADRGAYLVLDMTAPRDASIGPVAEGVIELAAREARGTFGRAFHMRAGSRGRYAIRLPAWKGKVAAIFIGLSSPGREELILHALEAAPGPSSVSSGDAASLESPATGLEFQATPIALDGRLPVSPARIDVASSAPPETRPVASDYTVAMWYFAAWEPEYLWDGWKQVAERAPWRLPLLHDSSDAAMSFGGIRYYRSSCPRVLNWHVHWMREHAVNLILWDWYPGAKPSGEFDPGFFGNRALEVGFLGKSALGGPPVKTNRFAEAISFAVMWTNHPPFDKLGAGLADYVADQFFLQPNYHRIDGKPFLILWSPQGLVSASGGEAKARAQIEALREAARKRGLAGTYVAAIATPAEIPLIRSIGLDGVAGYHYAGSGGHAATSRAARDRTLEDRTEDYASQTIPGHARLWRELADAAGREYLLATTPMQNWEPTLRPVNFIMRGTSPDAYREMLRRARAFIEARGLRRFVTVEAWNEWFEGSYVEPSTQWGFGWLEAIRDIFGKP